MQRVAQLAREIDAAPDAPYSVASLAAQAALSDFHFLRLFRAVTGVTPHQYVLRSRLRAASLTLVDSPRKIVDVAFDAGFNDVSNFNYAFRGEFGMSPRAWRAQGRDARRKARSA
jgi:AraC family transcriptional regulator